MVRAGGDEKIKLLLNSIAVIKKVNFLYHDKKNEVYFQKKEDKTTYKTFKQIFDSLNSF